MLVAEAGKDIGFCDAACEANLDGAFQFCKFVGFHGWLWCLYRREFVQCDCPGILPFVLSSSLKYTASGDTFRVILVERDDSELPGPGYAQSL